MRSLYLSIKKTCSQNKQTKQNNIQNFIFTSTYKYTTTIKVHYDSIQPKVPLNYPNLDLHIFSTELTFTKQVRIPISVHNKWLIAENLYSTLHVSPTHCIYRTVRVNHKTKFDFSFFSFFLFFFLLPIFSPTSFRLHVQTYHFHLQIPFRTANTQSIVSNSSFKILISELNMVVCNQNKYYIPGSFKVSFLKTYIFIWSDLSVTNENPYLFIINDL